MEVRMHDYPTRFHVSSRSEANKDYLVDLARYPIGTTPDGRVVYNGSCGRSDLGAYGCRDFLFRCEPRLKDPKHMGQVFRCAHIHAARLQCLDIMIAELHDRDPNIDEQFQT